MRWFRFYSEAVHDPKVQALPAPLFKAWVNLLCVAALVDKDGYLPCVEDLSYALHMPVKRAETMLSDLLKRELLDRERRGIRPHNWNARQFKSDSSTERSRKHRSNTQATLQQRPQKQKQRQRQRQNRTDPEAEAAAAPILSLLATTYEAEIGLLTPGMTDSLKEWDERIPNNGSGEAAIRYAFTEAVSNNKRRWKYVQSILERLEAEGWPAEPGAAIPQDASGTDLEGRYQRGKARARGEGAGEGGAGGVRAPEVRA